jgi:mono/diheme cytochrome c family protein
MSRQRVLLWVLFVAVIGLSCRSLKPEKSAPRNPAVKETVGRPDIKLYAEHLIDEGRKVFRYDTFGSEDYWGGKLRLHQAIADVKRGGTGAGITPHQALQLGLKVDSDQVPQVLLEVIRGQSIRLDEQKTTIELLKADAVVGVKGFFDDDKDRLRLTSIGITCALCHSTVDDSLVKGIGQRLDGWPNRDLDVGAIVALAPDLKPMAEPLQLSEDDLRKVLKSWGPGRYDAEVNQDGKAFRPDGKTAATLLPAAFGLAGVNLHTYSGWGSVTHWNAYVANTQMHGKGTFFDPRLNDKDQFPAAVRQGHHDIRNTPDLVSSKLPALHFYQLAIPAPKPKPETYDAEAADRGKLVFEGKADCARCHVPPIYTEPGWPMHTAQEMGIDDFHASRSPDKKFYRTTPLRGLFVRAKGGFYHDGRFADLPAVVGHYEKLLKLNISDTERADLIEFLKSL